MNILIIGKFYTEAFASHITETLSEMGHSCHHYEPGFTMKQASSPIHYRFLQVKGLLSEIYSKTNAYSKASIRKLQATISGIHIDLTIVCHDMLTPHQVSLLKKKTGSPVVLWFPDHIGMFGRSMFLNASYDFLFFKDPYIVNILASDLGISSFYLPECFNPIYHRPIELSSADREKYSCDITTEGNLHPNRAAFFKNLKAYDCKIWGNPASTWMDVSEIRHMIKNEFVANEEKSKAFIAGKIVINNLQPSEIFGLNVRAFEIAGCGGFQLVNWRPGIHQLFEVGKEIETFKNISELKEKINFYLDHEDARKEMANKSYKRAIKEHSYKHRIQLLIDTVNKKSFGFPIPEIHLC